MLLWQFPSSMTQTPQSCRASPASELHSKAPQAAWPRSYCQQEKLLKLSSLGQGMEHFIQGYTSCLGTVFIPPRNPKALALAPALPALLGSTLAGTLVQWHHLPQLSFESTPTASGHSCWSQGGSNSLLQNQWRPVLMTQTAFSTSTGKVRQKLQLFKICKNS